MISGAFAKEVLRIIAARVVRLKKMLRLKPVLKISRAPLWS
jgi:hypothetical protein